MLDDARVFHVNINCADLARSRAFYVEGCGLVEGVRTSPEHPQDGEAFGFERAWWDALILIGANGFDGGAIDLLQWLEPEPSGAPPPDLAEPGFQRIGLEVVDLEGLRRSGAEVLRRTDGSALVRDPDGTAVELTEGAAVRLAYVAVTCADLERSVAFYRTLGFRETARVSASAVVGPAVEVVLDAPGGGDVQLRLVGFEGVVPVPARPRPANSIGMWRTALLLPDLDLALERLRGIDVEPLSDPASMSMGPGLPELRFLCFRGPDDEVIELIEMPNLDEEG